MLLRQLKNLSPDPSPSVERNSFRSTGRSASKALARAAGLRPAATLTEVLVAIFIMGIGLLALLSLFPLGALSMAQAIKDDRTAHAAKSAFAIAELFNLHNDQNLYPASATVTDAFVNPYPVTPPGVGMPLQADPTKPSYPVYVDPYGYYFLTGQVGVGNTIGIGQLPLGIGIARRPPFFVTASANFSAAQAAIRWFTLLDDLTNWQDNAAPVLAPAAPVYLFPLPVSLPPGAQPTVAPGVVPTVQRANRYSWAYMLRRPKSGDPTVVDVSVVLYSGRSLSVLGESAYGGVIFGGYYDPTVGAVVPSNKFVDLPYPLGSTPPPIRRGSWILDATVVMPTPQGPMPEPHGYFYRVVEVTDIGSLPSPPYQAGSKGLRLELQANFKNQYNVTNQFATVVPGTNPPVPYGVLIVMENVVEVFDKGQGWKP